MKKRFLSIMLSAMLLFSSCETEVPAETTAVTTAETTAAVTTTTEQTTTTSVTTTSTVTTTPDISEDYKKDRIKPTVLDEKISYTAENHVEEEKLFYELWESFSCDFTKSGQAYEIASQYENQVRDQYPVEKNTALGHQYLEQWLDFYYIGTDEADWICVAKYGCMGFSPGGVYARIVLVKDNEIVREVCEGEMNLPSLSFIDNDIFVEDFGNLYKLNLEAGELKSIYSSYYSGILAYDERYLVYGGDDIVVIYNRETGEITETDIKIEAMLFGDRHMHITENSIEYYSHFAEKGMVYDLETGEIHENESLVFDITAENDEYIFSHEKDPSGTADGIKITRKSDGKTKIFDIPVNIGNEPFMRGSWCVFYQNHPFEITALNFETEEICTGNFEEIYVADYSPTADKFYIDDTDETCTIELIFPPERIKPIILDEKLTCTEKYSVNIEVEKQLWALCDYDYTKDESTYPIAVEQEFICNEFPEIANTKLGHQYLYMNLSYTFLGTEEADWICIARYMNDVAIPSFIYSEIVLVKDNKVVRQVWETEGPSPVGLHVSCGEIFMVTYGGIYSLDIETGEAVMLMDENYGTVVHIDENYIVYGESNIQIYDRRTGEVTETSINHNTYGSPSYNIRFRNNRLEYVDKKTEKGMFYDLETGENYEDESLEFYKYAENDSYIVRPMVEKSTDRYSEILITRKSDGLAKKFDVSEIAEIIGAENNNLRFLGDIDVLFSKEWILIHSIYHDWYALNFETEEAAIGDIGFSSNLIYSPDHDLFYKSDREVIGVIEPVFPF